MTNTTAKRLKELEERQQELERLIVVERSKTETKVPKEEIKGLFEKGLKLEPLMLINFFIKEIVLYDDQIKIKFNSPINNDSPDESRGYFFSEKSVDIPKYGANGLRTGDMTMTIALLMII